MIGVLKRISDSRFEKIGRIVVDKHSWRVSWLKVVRDYIWNGVDVTQGWFYYRQYRNVCFIKLQRRGSTFYATPTGSSHPAIHPPKMGWLWKSRHEDGSQHRQPSASSDAPQQPQTMTREEKADAELAQFLAFLNAEESRKSPTSSQSTPTSTESNQSSHEPPHPPLSTESLYPDSMSCRSAFDYAFFCQSFGGQFVNWYRYGELRSCSEHWDNFWMCMKTRTHPDEERKRAIRSHYRKKASKYKTGPSSEDVWDLRMEPVRNAFQGDFLALEKEMEAAGSAQHKAAATSN